MQCDKCVYWGNEQSSWAEERGFKICDRAVMMDSAFDWEHGEDGMQVSPKDPSLKMYVQDGSSYYAALYTAADFFCAHFTASAALEGEK